jgi:hypothetical protein
MSNTDRMDKDGNIIFKVGDIIRRKTNQKSSIFLSDVDRPDENFRVRYVDCSDDVCIEYLDGTAADTFSHDFRWSYKNFELVYPNDFSKMTSFINMDLEQLKTFNPKNVADGKKLAEDEKATLEVSEAKRMFKDLTNAKEEQERIIKVAQERLKTINENLNLFRIK